MCSGYCWEGKEFKDIYTENENHHRNNSSVKDLVYSKLYLIFRWFCHFDDDQYVNVLALEDKLRGLDSSQDWYLGKPSIEKPLEIMDRDSPGPDMKVGTRDLDYLLSLTI